MKNKAWKRAGIALLVSLGAGIALWATPSSGFLVNQILATGTTGNMNQQIQIARDSSKEGDERWQLQLQAQGNTDFYVQRLSLAPFGYSGWHSHPGLLIGTVISGTIDFYDADCRKVTYKEGDVFQENNQVHGIINNGPQIAELAISYLVKKGAARRIEASAPVCAATTPIP